MDDMVNTGTRVPGFKNKVMVDIEQMMSYAQGLRTSAPAEVMEAQEVIRQKESIINQANNPNRAGYLVVVSLPQHHLREKGTQTDSH